eukprot:TRINITY_DN33880_c0_g1_i1.p1 TRINITY_DN33880_c0_g1~~TRINITY_DN33880_c0_g1_i1.p1  ORF type:complete len:116 (-),score=19.14 TRINITY_DN33880_c0_g1_i1:300-614(-)
MYASGQTTQVGNLMTFQEFSANVQGNKKTTISDTWGLMLTAIPGVGKHAAFAIMELYPTPFSFYDAFGQIQSENDVVQQIAQLKAGQKAIGENVAKCLYQALLA